MADVSTSAPRPAITNGPGPTPAENIQAPVDAATSESQTHIIAAPQNGHVSANPNNKKKQDRPERPRLPLPDPIPEQPVKRYLEPSRAELQEKVNALDAKVQECFERLKAARSFVDQRVKIREDAKPALEKARAAMNHSNEALKVLFDKKKELTAKIKAIKDAEHAAASAGGATAASGDPANNAGGGKDVHVALRGCRTIEDVEARIRELEEMQMSSSLSLQEEKKLVAQISYLNAKGRDIVESKDKAFKDEKALKEKRIAERKALEDQRKAMDVQIDAAKAAVDANRAAFDRLRAEQDEQIRLLTEASKDHDRDAEKAKIAELKNEIKAVRDEFQKEHDQWYLNERIWMEQQKIAKRKRWEAQQAEREAKRLAWEAEQAQYPVADPYQPEKDMCNSLIFHLQNLLGEPTELSKVVKADSTTSSLLPVASVKPTLKKDATPEAREIAKASGKTIGKSVNQETTAFENDAYGVFATKTNKKSRRGRKSDISGDVALPGSGPITGGSSDEPSTDDDAKLKPHALDHLMSFDALGIKPPARRGELRSTLEQVMNKKKYFEDNPPPKNQVDEHVDGSAAGRDAKKNTGVETHKARKPSSSVSGLDGAAAFPGLGGESVANGSIASAPRVTEGDGAGRPSFSDIARGHARSAELFTPVSNGIESLIAVNGEEDTQMMLASPAGEVDAGTMSTGIATILEN